MHYIPLTAQDEKEMLERIGAASFKDLIDQIIPRDLQFAGKCGLPDAVSEHEVRRLLHEIAARNLNHLQMVSFMGAGIYDHYIPAIIDSLISRSEFYTAYTPYQAEVSQGTLQTIFEYQSVMCELTGMDVSNASMYDGGSALAEACHLACSLKGKPKAILADSIHPHYRRVTETYTRECGVELAGCPSQNGVLDIEKLAQMIDDRTACVCVQHPNFYGYLENMPAIEKIVHQKGVLFIAVIDPISLGVLMPPGEYNADVAVGEGQALGISQGFGGPLLGLFTSKMEYVRSLPGRIVGETADIEGKKGFVLTLQTREQHIRREKATSNICTNEALCALSSLIYLCSVGKKGIVEIGELCLAKSHYLLKKIKALKGIRPLCEQEFFKEFTVETDRPAPDIVDDLTRYNIFAGVPLSLFYKEKQNQMLIATTEKRSREEIDNFVHLLAKVL